MTDDESETDVALASALSTAISDLQRAQTMSRVTPRPPTSQIIALLGSASDAIDVAVDVVGDYVDVELPTEPTE